jgi:hypothetical protein
MARCERCDAAISMWDVEPCSRCNYPLKDIRDKEQIKIDNADYKERIRNDINSVAWLEDE